MGTDHLRHRRPQFGNVGKARVVLPMLVLGHGLWKLIPSHGRHGVERAALGLPHQPRKELGAIAEVAQIIKAIVEGEGDWEGENGGRNGGKRVLDGHLSS